MNVEILRQIINDSSLTDEQLEVMLTRATRKAVNHYFWKEDDIPTEEQVEKFCERYEYEIYDVAKAMYSGDSRGGMKSFTELGVQRVWESGGDKAVDNALSAIPTQTYVW